MAGWVHAWRPALLALSMSTLLAGIALAGVGLAAPSRSEVATPQPATLVGARLFVAKGCVTCHQHAAVDGKRVHPNAYPFSGIPDLTPMRFDAAYLRSWLADPTAVRPTTTMPNLNLSPDEIEALVAFLTQPPPANR
jgi:cytochrome c1